MSCQRCAHYLKTCRTPAPLPYASTVGEQLGGKLALHNVLLQCLSDGGCLAQLHPATLRLALRRAVLRWACLLVLFAWQACGWP